MLNNDLKEFIYNLDIPYETKYKYFNIFKNTNLKFIKQRVNRLIKLPKRGVTLYRFFLTYGKKIGLEKWNLYKEKQAYSNSKEYKNMSGAEFRDYNKSRAVTLENLTKKYGKIEGKIKFEKYVEKQKYTKSKQYYLDKYGESVGILKYNETCKKKSRNLKNFIRKYGEVEGLKRWEKYKKLQRIPFSNIASELFTKLDKTLKSLIFEPKTREFLLETKRNYFYYDCFHKESNTIIEFNGDYFHINPKLYNKNKWKPIFNLSYDKIKNKDLEKQRLVTENNLNLIIVWESYYKKDKKECVKTILKLLENNFKGVKELNI